MRYLILFAVFLIAGCSTASTALSLTAESEQANKIKVLNFGSFHFGVTNDATKVEFDENDVRQHAEVRKIAELIAQFKPTIVCLEFLPEDADKINQAYQAYVAKPDKLNTAYGELSMIGFEVARLRGLATVHGIDNHMGYNYSLGDFIESSPELDNAIDRQTYLELTNDPYKHYPQLKALNSRFDQLSLNDKLRLTNHPLMLEHSLNTNADKLFYVGIDDGFEGAEQAAQFYLRNMKIYSNLNRIQMHPKDRVFILMGSAHTAMLKEFINRSPKFEMVDTSLYLQPSALTPFGR